MRPIKCLFGHHNFSEWIEVANHLERECLRCGKMEAKYPDPLTSIAKIASGLIWKYYEFNTSARNIIYNNIRGGKMIRNCLKPKCKEIKPYCEYRITPYCPNNVYPRSDLTQNK